MAMDSITTIAGSNKYRPELPATSLSVRANILATHDYTNSAEYTPSFSWGLPSIEMTDAVSDARPIFENISKHVGSSGRSNDQEQEGMFIYFRKLPTELRCKIWRYFISGPKTIKIQSLRPLKVRCTEKLPACFFACRDARTEFLRTHQRLYVKSPGTGSIYLDFKQDAIYCPYSWAKAIHALLQMKATTKVGRLMITARSIGKPSKFTERLFDLANLKELVILKGRLPKFTKHSKPLSTECLSGRSGDPKLPAWVTKEIVPLILNIEECERVDPDWKAPVVLFFPRSN